MSDEHRPLTAGQVAERFGVHPTTVHGWVAAGKLTCFRTPGGHRRFLAADVEALLAPHAAEVKAS